MDRDCHEPKTNIQTKIYTADTFGRKKSIQLKKDDCHGAQKILFIPIQEDISFLLPSLSQNLAFR